MTAIRLVEDLRVGDLVHFTPGYRHPHPPDLVLKIHLRKDALYPEAPELTRVTVTHQKGCWSKGLGDTVEVVGRTLVWERQDQEETVNV